MRWFKASAWYFKIPFFGELLIERDCVTVPKWKFTVEKDRGETFITFRGLLISFCPADWEEKHGRRDFQD